MKYIFYWTSLWRDRVWRNRAGEQPPGLKPRGLYTERSRGFENPLPRTEVRGYTTGIWTSLGRRFPNSLPRELAFPVRVNFPLCSRNSSLSSVKSGKTQRSAEASAGAVFQIFHPLGRLLASLARGALHWRPTIVKSWQTNADHEHFGMKRIRRGNHMASG